jgi:hypothetical protein
MSVRNLSSTHALSLDDGLDVVDAAEDVQFRERPTRPRDRAREMQGVQRIVRACVISPDAILQELVDVAVELCGADSAGISIEKEGGSDREFYHWAATAGQYSGFLDARLPRYPSACGMCLERGRPQLFRVRQRFFDILGVEAPLVTDGILLPWQVEQTRGTIFVMAHGRSEAFDSNDLTLMQMLAEFAAMGVQQQSQQKLLLEQAGASAASAMANRLAHRINNPLQSLTNILYLAASGHNGEGAKEVGTQALADLERLSALVYKLLALPYGATAA